MNYKYIVLIAIVIVLVSSVVIGCSGTTKPSIDDGKEESGTELALDETYDNIRNGVRLVMNYNPQSNTFNGTIENTTDETLKKVRVEVHLSNGKELGPTVSINLASGEKSEVQLIATSTDFDGWTAHPEVGEGEHGSGGEHGEEDSEHGGEHDTEGEDEHN